MVVQAVEGIITDNDRLTLIVNYEMQEASFVTQLIEFYFVERSREVQ